jgi:tetratricopeptide (TPR) repeat protein
MVEFRKSWVALLIVLLASLQSLAREKPWLEVVSPHFHVLTDGSESDGRHVAHEFEQIRTVFAQQFHGFRLDTGAPMLIFAPKDEPSMKALAPEFWKQKGAKPAGFYSRGWEQQYAVVRLDQVGPDGYEVIYHEYIHALLHMNFRWLPVWLDEGLAEFYGYTRFDKDKTYIGVPSNRSSYLQNHTLIKIETLLKVNQASPYYHEQDKAQLFYAEAWALVHYLIFGPGMGNGDKLNQYYALLQQGMDETKAFKQIFGEFAPLDNQLLQYTMKFSFTAALFKSAEQQSAKDYAVRTLTPAESEAQLGLFHFYGHNKELARTSFEAAMQDDPKLALAHEGMGFLDFQDGKDEDAVKEFSQAYELDHKLYLSLFFKTMMAPAAQDQTDFRLALLQVLEVNRNFAPVYVELARMYLHSGGMENALRMARKAAQLEPSRAGYNLLEGRILLRMGKGAEAAPIAKYVADRWSGPDHNEAVELWNDVPAAERPADEQIPYQIPEGVKSVEGALRSLECGDKDHKLQLTVDHGGQMLNLRADGGFGAGYSDTIWYGRDHFSLCQHLQGMHVIARYKPASDNSGGILAELEVRESLPQAPVAAEKAAEKQ